MTYTPSASNVMLGRGALYFDRRTSTDNTVGSFHLGNCDQFGMNVATEKLTLKDFTQQSTSNYKEVVSSTDVGLTISGFEFSKDTMALATMGTISTYTQTSGSVTAETLASVTVTGLKGRTFFTAYKNISAVALKQGATTFVLNTDYTIVDAVRGMIKILTTGAVADGTALTIDYTKAAMTGGSALDAIFGGANSAIEGKLRFVSNNTTGPNWDFTGWNVSLRPNGDVSFISEEFNKFTLEGTAQSDAAGAYGGSASSPYYTLTQIS